ncbi:hypothetical protein SeMB42_g05340, partial [Synchytrium endobioticum]
MSGTTGNGQGSAESSMSIDETNALRIKLGLKPLDPGNQSAKDKEATNNYDQARDAAREKDATAQALDSIERSKTRRKLRQKLDGPTLGDASQDIDDTLAWIQRSRQKRLELARQKEKELEEMDQDAIKDYTSSDLTGLRVAHDLGDFADGAEKILVLKDSTIEENEEGGDELLSVAVADSEKLRKNLENKRRKKPYTGFDDEDLASGRKKNILSQYDDEDQERSGFVIAAQGRVNIVDDETRRSQIAEKLKANAISLEHDKMREIKDYYTAQEMPASFKKPKDKRKKPKVRRRTDVEDEPNAAVDVASASTNANGHVKDQNDDMDVDSKPRIFAYSNKDVDIDGTNFVDDDDLHMALARARRSNIRNKPKMTEEEIAKMAREAEELQNQHDAETGGGMTLSDTSEFVRTLSTAPPFQPVVKREVQVQPERSLSLPPEMPSRLESIDVDMQDITSTGAMDLDEREEGELDDLLEEFDEPLVSTGLAATVALLSQKGLVRKADQTQLEKERKDRRRQEWMNEAHRRQLRDEMEKQKKRAAGKQGKDKGKNRGGGDAYYDEEEEYRRESESRAEERRRLREIEDRYKDYKPEVEIKYHDEFGRIQTPKEAFKTLSYQFHGKRPGKQKTEKKLARIAQELREKAMPPSDTPLGTGAALLDRQQQT